jgi:hypothetical protein
MRRENAILRRLCCHAPRMRGMTVFQRLYRLSTPVSGMQDRQVKPGEDDEESVV